MGNQQGAAAATSPRRSSNSAQFSQSNAIRIAIRIAIRTQFEQRTAFSDGTTSATTFDLLGSAYAMHCSTYWDSFIVFSTWVDRWVGWVGWVGADGYAGRVRVGLGRVSAAVLGGGSLKDARTSPPDARLSRRGACQMYYRGGMYAVFSGHFRGISGAFPRTLLRATYSPICSFTRSFFRSMIWSMPVAVNCGGFSQ